MSLRVVVFILGIVLIVGAILGLANIKAKAACEEKDEFLPSPKAVCEATAISPSTPTAGLISPTPTNAAGVAPDASATVPPQTSAPEATPTLAEASQETPTIIELSPIPPSATPVVAGASQETPAVITPSPAIPSATPVPVVTSQEPLPTLELPPSIPSVTPALVVPPISFTPVPLTPTPPGENQLNLWFRGAPVALLGTHILQPHEYLFCIGRAYGVLPQAIAEVNGLALEAPLFDGQALQIPDVRWVNIPPGQVCSPQFNSPYAHAPVSMITTGLRLLKFILPEGEIIKVGSQLVSLAVAPTPELAKEPRTVTVKWPFQMFLGTSSQVALILDPASKNVPGTDTTSPGNTTTTATLTPESNPLIKSIERAVDIHDVFDECRVTATARLDAVGFSYSPLEEDTQRVNRGTRVAWHWSIKPLDVEQQELILSLKLHFDPKNDPQKLGECQVIRGDKQYLLGDEHLWDESFPVDVWKPWLSLESLVLGGGLGTIMALVTSVLDILDRLKSKKDPSDAEKSK